MRTEVSIIDLSKLLVKVGGSAAAWVCKNEYAKQDSNEVSVVSRDFVIV